MVISYQNEFNEGGTNTVLFFYATLLRNCLKINPSTYAQNKKPVPFLGTGWLKILTALIR